MKAGLPTALGATLLRLACQEPTESETWDPAEIMRSDTARKEEGWLT